MQKNKVFSKSLDTVRLPDPVNRLCKIKFTGVFECQESSIGTRGGPTGEADGSLYWEGVEPSWPSGWQRWLHCCCDGRGRTRAWVSAGTHINHSYSRASVCWWKCKISLAGRHFLSRWKLSAEAGRQKSVHNNTNSGSSVRLLLLLLFLVLWSSGGGWGGIFYLRYHRNSAGASRLD